MDAGGVVGVLSTSVMLNTPLRHVELVSASYFFNPSEIKTLKQVQGDGRERHDDVARGDAGERRRGARYAAIFDLAQCRVGPCRPQHGYPV